MYLICEYYGERPRNKDTHIRKVDTCFAAVGGAFNEALCTFAGILHDHPSPPITHRDLSRICPTCRSLYRKAIAKK